MDEARANKAVAQAALVSQKIREALQASLPVAPEQLMTVQIPGTIIDTSETGPYVWNDREEADTPHRVRVNESRLVDNMVPLSKVIMGITGKSVARSYLAALDMLIPEDAPIDIDKSTTSKSAAAERYVGAMKYLTSPAPGSSRTVIDIYVEKQQAYSEAMNKWEAAKTKVRLEAKERFPGDVRKQQTFFDDWNQENFRNFKNNAQAKYMDWVVNGNKYKVDYYFGIVDVSSAMKRVESSKEASRNLIVIDPDGSTEWNEVNLTPANWATICREKVIQWQAENGRLSRQDYESEIKRLNRLLLSYSGLKLAIDPDGSKERALQQRNPPPKTQDEQNGTPEEGAAPKALTNGSETNGAVAKTTADTELDKADTELKAAYQDLYKSQNTIPPVPSDIRAKQDLLQTKLEAHSKANLTKNKEFAADANNKNASQKLLWVNSMIEDTKSQIALLQQGLQTLVQGKSAAPAITEIVKQEVKSPGQTQGGELIATKYADDGDQNADAKFGIPRHGVAVVPPGNVEPSKWTKISLSVSSKSQETSSSSSSSSTSASVGGGGGWWSASASFNHSEASMKASESTASCDVTVKFEALLVTIDRAWLHGELFSDPELNTNPDVALSPGALSLHKYIDQKDSNALSKYPYFPSYPTAFIVAANIELEFSGNTSNLESAVESSHTDAQVKVGWGPFSLSASHSQDNSSSKTKMETTATGTRITLEAPAIIGWVSQLVPQLPRPRGTNYLLGPMV